MLIDVNMPVMNGFETLAQIKSSPALKHIPVILMSSDDGRSSGTVLLPNPMVIVIPPGLSLTACDHRDVVAALRVCVRIVRENAVVSEGAMTDEGVVGGPFVENAVTVDLWWYDCTSTSTMHMRHSHSHSHSHSHCVSDIDMTMIRIASLSRCCLCVCTIVFSTQRPRH